MSSCKCGCKADVPQTYKQGHDARHVSQLLQAGHTPDQARAELSAPLLAKFTHAFERRQRP